MAQDYTQILVRLALQNEEYLKQLVQAQTATQNAAKGMSDAFSGIASMLGLGNILGIASVAGSLALIKTQLTECATAAMNFEDAQQKLTTTLQGSNYVAGFTTKGLMELTEQLSKNSVYTKTAIMDMESVLLRAINIRGEIFKQAAQTIIDVAAARRETDLTGIATSISKALENPANATRALRSLTKELTAEEQTHIASLMATGRVTEAQSVILQRFSMFHGQAADQITTTSGALKMLQKESEEANIRVGQKLLPTISALAKQFGMAGVSAKELVLSVFLLGNRAGGIAMNQATESAEIAADAKEIRERALVEENKGAQMRLYNQQKYATELASAKLEIDNYIAKNDKDNLEAQIQREKSAGEKLLLQAKKFGYKKEETEKAAALAIEKVEREHLAKRAKWTQEGLQVLSQALSGIDQLMTQRMQNQLSAMDNIASQRKGILDFFIKDDAKRAEAQKLLDLKNAIQRNHLERQAFEAHKATQYAMAVVNLASGIAGVIAISAAELGLPGLVAGVIGAAALAVSVAINLATIAQTRAPDVQISYEKGTAYVPQNQLAYLHQGERVVPASENRGFNPPINIYMNHVYDKVGVMQVLKEVLGANNIRFSTRGAY